jgi:hypothetical protein
VLPRFEPALTANRLAGIPVPARVSATSWALEPKPDDWQAPIFGW